MPTRPPRFQPYKAAPDTPRVTRDQWRGSAASRGYGGAWRRAREGFLQHHPLCVRCLANRQITAATVVDHIQPHGGNMVLFWQYDNWQALCKPCHDAKTATEDGGFGNQKRPHKGP